MIRLRSCWYFFFFRHFAAAGTIRENWSLLNQFPTVQIIHTTYMRITLEISRKNQWCNGSRTQYSKQLWGWEREKGWMIWKKCANKLGIKWLKPNLFKYEKIDCSIRCTLNIHVCICNRILKKTPCGGFWANFVHDFMTDYVCFMYFFSPEPLPYI